MRDVSELEELVNLQKLWLAHNQICEIEGLRSLKRLRVLSVFNNGIFHGESALRVAESLPELSEFAIDGNPCNANSELKYHIIMRLELDLLNDEKITQLERDVAEQFYRKSKLELPKKKRTTEESSREAPDETVASTETEGGPEVKENKDPK